MKMKYLNRLACVAAFFLLTRCSNNHDESLENPCNLLDTDPCSSAISPPDIDSLRAVSSLKYDVIIVMGQSNTLAGSGYDSILDKGHPRIFQLGRREHELDVIEAKEPLDHHEYLPGFIGFAMTFGKWYASTFLASDRNILIIPCGQGGSGFDDHRWNRGDDLYVDAVMRTNYVLERFPGSNLKTVLWHQGEDDVDSPYFQEKLDSMIVNFRRDVPNAKDIPFILGGMVPYWSDQSDVRRLHECILKTTPDRISLTAYADPRIPCRIVKTDDAKDEIHYNAEGARLLGYRYFDAYRSLQQK